jgi:hypothetical protein
MGEGSTLLEAQNIFASVRNAMKLVVFTFLGHILALKAIIFRLEPPQVVTILNVKY